LADPMRQKRRLANPAPTIEDKHLSFSPIEQIVQDTQFTFSVVERHSSPPWW
jgi:hypothetical protein